MSEELFHKKVYIFTGILSFMVIWTHAQNVALFFKINPPEILAQIQYAVSLLGAIAVPGFFMLSSYLFFRHLHRDNLLRKLKQRIFSTLLPYFTWNALYYIGYLLASRLPYIRDIFGKGTLRIQSQDALFAVVLYRYNPVFWFVYQLILLIAISPILYLILRRTWSGCLFLLCVLFLVYIEKNSRFLNADALFYYSLAGFFSIHFRSAVECKTDFLRYLLSAVLFLFSCILFQTYMRSGFAMYAVLYRSFSVIGLWLILYIPKQLPIPWLLKNSFFTYAIHFALVRLINKACARFFHGSSIISLGLFFFMPVLILLLSGLLSYLLRLLCPPLHRLLTGGRGS